MMMNKIIATALRIALNLALPVVFIGFGTNGWHVIRAASIFDQRPSAFLLGCAMFVPVWFVARRLTPGVVGYLTTLEHELTHILIGLLFLIRPVWACRKVQ